VVINEFELNPPGDDYAPGAEFVELYNSGPAPVDVGGWKVVSTHGVPVVVTIPAGVGISPGGFYVVGHSGQWLDNTDEQIILRDAGGVEVDRTPVKSDPFNDARTWQRYPDGAANWVFDTATKMAVNVPEFQQPTFFAAVALIGALALVRKDSRRAKLFGRISCWAVSRPVEKSET
jgi:hypothetical protein